MEPTTTLTPSPAAPVMDVTPPAQAVRNPSAEAVSVAVEPGSQSSAHADANNVVEAPQEEPSESGVANSPEVTAPAEKATKQPAKITSTPTLAIALAMLVCVVLSILAYYAYTKNK